MRKSKCKSKQRIKKNNNIKDKLKTLNSKIKKLSIFLFLKHCDFLLQIFKIQCSAL